MTSHDQTGQPVSGSTRMRWRRHHQAVMIHRTAATSATTDRRYHSTASAQGAA
jgi:hypothetical protein